MTGMQRAAVVLLSMGESSAAEVLKHLNPRDVQKLGMAMTTITGMQRADQDAVMGEFINALDNTAGIGGGAEDYVRNVLTQALGEERAGSLIDRILLGRNTSGLDTLKWMDPKAIAELIHNEHPQIIAIVLAHLDHDQAAETLKLLPDDLRADIVLRLATLDGIPPHALNELNDVMMRQFSGSQGMKSSSIGGLKMAAGILNFMDSGQDETILVSIDDMDQELSGRLRELMFVFEDLVELDDRSMQTLMREIPGDKLPVALRGCDDNLRDRFLNNMSQRAREVLLEDMEARGPVRLSEVESAQKEILAAVRRLQEAGDIQLGGGKSEAFV
ncbi:MAG: flagellar motor switch protein FliG [Pseudomonadota bacterium]|nr:flagellar motor switch protein FliG [Pseudomonadota bacterium]